MSNKPIPAGYNPSGIYVNHYGCVKCQTRHFEDEDIYAKHIYWQSRHGIDSMPMEQRLEIVMMEQEGLER
jgi:hypothetical protein